jgi:hypothetical protein
MLLTPWWSWYVAEKGGRTWLRERLASPTQGNPACCVHVDLLPPPVQKQGKPLVTLPRRGRKRPAATVLHLDVDAALEHVNSYPSAMKSAGSVVKVVAGMYTAVVLAAARILGGRGDNF